MDLYKDISENNQIHALNLQFKSKRTEQEYLLNYNNTFEKANRNILIISILFYISYILIDKFVFKESNPTILFIRYAVTIPIACLTLIASFFKPAKKNTILLYSLIVAFCGLSFSYIVLLKTDNLFSPSLFGVILFYLFAFNLIRITFARSFTIVGIIFILYHGYLITTSEYYSNNAYFSSFFLVLSFIFSAYSAYLFEKMDRKNFAINFDLQKRNNKYKKLKAHLENTVNVRTKELKIANDDLHLAKQKAEESNKLKTNFLATISHEIRTPLTSIVGFSQLITKAKSNPDKVKKYVETVEVSTGQLLHIIDNILELSKIHSNSHTSSESEINSKLLTQEFEEVAFNTLKKYGKNLHVHSQFDERALFCINMGRNELSRIILHLTDNAIKYTEEGEVSFYCKINKDNLFEMCISDSGLGITQEQQGIIFDFFRQIDQDDTRRHSGIGVGLSICKGLIHKSSGSIWIESKPNNGTKVFVTIPLSR